MHKLIQYNTGSNTKQLQNRIAFEINRQIDKIETHHGLIASVLTLKYLNIGHESNILKHLFGREMQKRNLIDLFSLGRCSTDFYQITLNYIIKLVSSHLYYNQFPIQELDEGIQILTDKGLKVDSKHLIPLKEIFQNQFIGYLNNTHSDISVVKDTIEYMLQTFDIVKNVKNEILKDMLHSLAIALTTSNTTWQEKVRVLDLIIIFIEKKLLQGKNTIINQIINITNVLLDHSQEEVVNASLLIIAQLATTGLIKEVNKNVIKNIYTKLANLLECGNSKVFDTATLTICELAEANLFEEPKEANFASHVQKNKNVCLVNNNGQMNMIELETFPQGKIHKSSPKQGTNIVQTVCFKAIGMLDHEQWSEIKDAISSIDYLYEENLLHEVDSVIIENICLKLAFILEYKKDCEIDSITWIIYKFANGGLLKRLSNETIEFICLTVLKLLRNNQEDKIVAGLMSLLGQLAEADLLATINFNLVADILLNAKKLMAHKNEAIVTRALGTIRQIVTADLPLDLATDNKLIEDLCIHAKELLNHKNTLIIDLTLQGLGKLAEANLLKSVESQFLWDICDKAELFLKHDQKALAAAALSLLNEFVAANLLVGLDLKVIRAILRNAKVMMMPKEFHDCVIETLLAMVQNASPVALDEEKSKIVEDIFINAKELLHTQGKEAMFAMISTGLFASSDLPQFIAPNLIKGIVTRIKHQMSHENEDVVIYAISTLSAFAAADLMTIDLVKDALLQVNDIIIKKAIIISLLNLDSDDEKVIITGMAKISLLADSGLFKEKQSGMIDTIIDKANILLDHSSERVRNALMRMIDKLTSC